jgi:putative FmdB family regulatory protein
MPTYQYQCVNGHQFELFQRISDRPRAKCPTCGARAGRVITGGAGLIFKGSGFYITDYGKDGKGPRKEAAETVEKPGGPEKAAAADQAGAPKPAAAETKPSKKAEKAKE